MYVQSQIIQRGFAFRKYTIIQKTINPNKQTQRRRSQDGSTSCIFSNTAV